MKKKYKKAFTLVELIISIFILAIIILPLLILISDTYSEINHSNIRTENISKIYEIRDKISNIKWEYLSWSILINNNIWNGSDVLLFRTEVWDPNKKWYIFAQVDYNTLKIDWSLNINNIWEKYFAYRKISETELIELELNPNKVYDYKFNLDKIFKWIIIKNFQIDYFNNKKILELSIDIYKTFNKSSLIEEYTEVKKQDLEKFILNF